MLTSVFLSLASLAPIVLTKLAHQSAATLPSEASNEPVPTALDFGHKMRTHFCMDPNYINLNHGSYGSPPRWVMDACHKYMQLMDANADRWFRTTSRPLVSKVQKRLATHVGAQSEDLVLVDNVSAAVNAIFRSLDWQPGDKLLFFSTVYGMVKQTLHYLRDTFQVQLVQVELTEAIISGGKSSIIQAMREKVIEEGAHTIRFATMDHITSTPAVVFPVQEMAQELKTLNPNMLVHVDGAHAIGQIPIQLSTMGVDFYCSNCHKWLFSAKGSAFLWVDKKQQPSIHPPVISFGYKKGLQEEFIWTGTRDISQLLTIGDALDWREKVGEQRIIDYNHTLAIAVGQSLSKIWNTRVLALPENMIPALINVKLPIPDSTSQEQVDQLVTTIFTEHNLYMVAFRFDNSWWTRLSAQIYNELSDFEMLGHVVNKLLFAMNTEH